MTLSLPRLGGIASARRRTVNLGVGGVMSVEISPDGWFADLTFKGQVVGGTYSLSPDTAPKFSLLVTSLGFDDTGTPITVQRTVVGTKEIRKPYPNELTNQETVFGTADVTVRVALSDYVFAKDKAAAGASGVDVVATVLPGLYTSSGGTASLGGTLTATNNSTAPYPKVIGNWSWVPHERVTTSIRARLVAFHRSGRLGRPVRAVRFTATDGTASVSQFLTHPEVDLSVGDAVPVPEYVSDLPTATLAQGQVTVGFRVYPWIGDADSVLDTAVGGTSGTTPLYGPRQVLNDKAGTYGQSFATVDTVNGSDVTGAVVGTGMPTAPFLTIAAAYNAVRSYNNTTFGRNDAGGSTIYLRTGSHSWTGGTVTDGTEPATYLTVTRHPDDPRAGVLINSTTGSKRLGTKVRMLDVSIAVEINTGMILPAAGSFWWFDRCAINIPTASRPLITNSVAAVWYVTRCLVTALSQGFRPFGVNPIPCALVRGNTLGQVNQSSLHYMIIGNKKTDPTTQVATMTDRYTGMTAPVASNGVAAYNSLSSNLSGGPLLSTYNGDAGETHGFAFVQNLLECTANVPNPLAQIGADNSLGTVDNVLVWHNTVVGQRFNMGYNDLEPAAYPRRYWSVKGNVWDDNNTKHDVFLSPTAGRNGARVGGWPVLFGVGFSGNAFAEIAGIGAPGSFGWTWPGLSAYHPPLSTVDGSSSTNPLGFLAFVNRKSFDGTNPGAGGGDYRLQASSPVRGLAKDWVLSHDLSGTPRSAGSSDPGPYVPVRAPLPALSTATYVAHFRADEGLTVVDGKVSQWNDLSGAGNHATQTDPLMQPFATTDKVGRKVVLFTAVSGNAAESDGMTFGEARAVSTRNVSMFTVDRVYFSNAGATLIAQTGASSGFVRNLQGSAPSTPPQIYAAGSRPTGFRARINRQLLSIVSSATAVDSRTNITGEVSSAAATTAQTLTGFQMNRLSATGGAGTSEVYERIVVEGPLTQAERDAIDAYLIAGQALRTEPYPRGVVFEGDSIMAGTFTDSKRGAPALVQRGGLDDWELLSAATSGATMTSMRSRSPFMNLLRHPTAGVKCFMIGTNGDGADSSADAYWTNLVAEVNESLAAGFREVWVCTVIAASNATTTARVFGYNARIRGQATGGVGPGIAAGAAAGVTVPAGAAVRVIDLAAIPEFSSSAAAAAGVGTIYGADGLHPLEAGELLIANKIVEFMRAFVPPVAA